MKKLFLVSRESPPSCFLNNTFITHQQAEFLLKAFADPPLFSVLVTEHILDISEEPLKNKEVFSDFLREQVRFSIKMNFSIEQVSTFLSICLFFFGRGLHKVETEEKQTELLLAQILERHAIHCPPFAEQIFQREHLERILKQLMTIRRNSLLYEMTLTKYVDFNILTKQNMPSLPSLKPVVNNGG